MSPRVGLCAVVAAVLAVAGTLAGSSVASSPAVTPVRPVFHFYGVSCPSQGACLAVGDSLRAGGGTVGELVSVVGGSPTQRVRVLSVRNFSGVACPGASRCIVVGQRQGLTTAVVASVVNGRPVRVLSLLKTFLFGIACGTPTSCWATGENASFRHALAVHIVSGVARDVHRLSGIYPGAFHDDSSIPFVGPLAAAPAGPPPACWSGSSCLVVGGIGRREANGVGKSDRAGLIVSLNGGTIRAVARVATGHLAAVACTSPSSCFAAGQTQGGFSPPARTGTAKLVAINDGRPTGTSLLQYGDQGVAQPSGLSCVDTTHCYLSGPAQIEAIAMGQPGPFTPTNLAVDFSAISCTQAGCLAVGGQSPRPNVETGVVYQFTPF